MVSIEDYKKNPCGLLSLPYWKAVSIVTPDHIKIVHDSEYSDELSEEYTGERYFRLFQLGPAIVAEVPEPEPEHQPAVAPEAPVTVTAVTTSPSAGPAYRRHDIIGDNDGCGFRHGNCVYRF